MPTVEELTSRPPSTNPDDYEGLRPHAPGTVAALTGDPLAGWSDESIPAAARLGSFVRERGRDETRRWDDIAAEARSVFGVDAAQLRPHVELERARALAEKDQTLSEGDYGTRLISNLARDLPFSPGNIIERREYEKARKKFDEGKAAGQDVGVIANYEARQKRLGNESDLLQIARAGSGLAKMGAEFLVGGPAAGAAVARTGLTGAARFGAEAAVRTATVPSLGAYEKTFERAFAAGRTEPNAVDIAQGFTAGLANSIVAGQIERFGAKGLSQLGVTSPAATVPVGAVAGTLEDDVSAAVLKQMDLETRYGPVVELLQGKRGDNVGRLMHSLIGEGIFAGVGALRGPAAFDAPPSLDAAKMQAVVDAGVKALGAEAAAGKTADEAARDLWPVQGAWEETILRGQGTSELFLKAARARMGESPSPAAEKFAEELAATLPKEIDPFEGLSEQQVRDVAAFAGVKATGKAEAVKERVLADDKGRALLVAEGRLPRPEPTRGREPPAPEPRPETPPESPRTADPAPEVPTPVQVDDRAPESAPAPQPPDRLKRLTARARERSATTPPRPGRTEAGAELRQPREQLSPQQKLARTEVLLERAGEQARAMRGLRLRAEAAREAPYRAPEGADPGRLTKAERKEVRRLAAKAKEPDELPAKASPAAGSSLVTAVVRYGGIDTDSAEFKKFFSSAREAREYGLTRPGLFKKGGKGIDQLAKEMHAAGHLPDADPQTLVDMLTGRKESHAVADDQAAAGKAYLARARELEAAPEPARRTDLFGRPVPRSFGRSGGTQLSIEDQLREGWVDAARAWAAENGVEIDSFKAGGQFTAGDRVYQVSGPEDGHKVSEVPEGPDRVDPELGWMRGDAGRKLDAALAANPRLTERDRAEIKAAVAHVNGVIPEAVRAKLDEAARAGRIDYQFFADHRSLTEATQQALLDDPLLTRDLRSPDPAVRAKAEADRAKLLQGMELIRQGKFTGLGSHYAGVVRIDGPGTSTELEGRYGQAGGALGRVGIAAHEVGHQIAKLFGLDSRADWQAVWAKDIAPKNALTRYASQDAKEGFAEFARLLYGSDVSTAAVRRDFPNATRFFERAGLFPAERAGRDGPLDNRFVLKVGTGEYHLDAGRGGLLSRVREAVGWLEADRPPQGPRETALANQRVDEERVARGVPPLLTAARLTNPEVWDAAMAKVAADPDLPARLTNELEAEPRATTVEENAVLLHRKVTLGNAHRAAMLDLRAAQESGAPPGDVDRLAARERNYFEAMDRLDRVTRRTGTEWGRAGQFRRQLAAEDYSLGDMLLRAQAAAGRPLTDKEHQLVGAQQQAIEKAQARLDAAETPVAGAFGTPGKAAQPAAPAGKPGDLTDLRIAVDKAKKINLQTLADLRTARLPAGKRLLARVGDLLGFSRSLRTAFDLSMVLRQGGVFAVTRPAETWKAVRRLQDVASERGYDRVMAEVRSRENAALYEDAGLYLADPDSLSAQEEGFATGLTRRMLDSKAAPARWLGEGVRGSERLYSGYLNLLRANVFDSMVSTLSAKGRPTLEEARAVANFVNVATGRGPLGESLGRAATPLSQLFFSPRFVASRFQLLAGQPVYGGTAATRKLIAWEYARLLAGLGVLYGVVSLLAGDEAEVSFDPRGTDFGKIRFGDTTIDPLAGLAQTTSFVGKLATGQERDRAGVVTPTRGEGAPAGGTTTMDVISKFVRQKLAPAPGEVVNVLVGENGVGEPTTLKSVAVGLTVPMSVENIYEGFDRLSVPQATATGLLNTLGVGVSSLGPRDEGSRAIRDAHAMRRRWEYSLGRPAEPRTGSPATAAMQKAAAADDYEAFRSARTDFLNRQILRGRTRAQAAESFRESVARIDPLEGRLDDRDRVKFLAGLGAAQKARLLEARAVARERRAKMTQWWGRAAREESR